MEELEVMTAAEPQAEAETTTESAAETVENAEPAVEETTETAEESTVSAEEGAVATEEPLITVKFNKQTKRLSVADATTYAQKGMKYDSISPTLESLRYLASVSGKSVSDFVESVKQEQLDKLYDDILDRCDGKEDIAKELFEAKKAEIDKNFNVTKAQEAETEKQQETEIAERLAGELADARDEFPGEISNYSQLPLAVRRDVEENGTSILNAYLLYKHREEKKAAELAAKAAEANKASAGSLSSAAQEPNTDPVFSSFIRGLMG